MNVDFGKTEVLPTVVQDARTGLVRMVGYMNREAYERTRETGELHLYSRSRQRLWRKGETSGHVHRVVSLRPDCDGDALLVLCHASGPTCHLGNDSCFADLDWGEDRAAGTLPALARVIDSRLRVRPEGSYTAKLAAGGVAHVAQKVGEEAVETVIAGLASDPSRLPEEAADLIYHLLVLLAVRGVGLDQVLSLLEGRRGERG